MKQQMQRRALLSGLGSLAFSCGPKPRPAPPLAPSVKSAGDFIPSDLEVVVRLDLGRIKKALGAITLMSLARGVLTDGTSDQEPNELVVSSLLDAELVYLGYRPSAQLMPLDRVLALSGTFPPILRPPANFSGATDLGGDVRYWERKPGGAKARGAVARIYAQGERLRAFVSEAEIDSVERVLTGQGAERRLTPPEEGTLSLAARAFLLTRLARGSLRGLFDDAKVLHAVADLESDGVVLELDLTLADPQRAARLASAGQQVLMRSAHGAGVDLRAEGERVLLSARLSRAQLSPALSCLRDGSGLDCAW